MGKRKHKETRRKRKHFGYMLQPKESLSRYIILSKSGKLRTKDHPQTYEGIISKEHQGGFSLQETFQENQTQ
jgi:hypothetical protein